MTSVAFEESVALPDTNSLQQDGKVGKASSVKKSSKSKVGGPKASLFELVFSPAKRFGLGCVLKALDAPLGLLCSSMWTHSTQLRQEVAQSVFFELIDALVKASVHPGGRRKGFHCSDWNMRVMSDVRNLLQVEHFWNTDAFDDEDMIIYAERESTPEARRVCDELQLVAADLRDLESFIVAPNEVGSPVGLPVAEARELIEAYQELFNDLMYQNSPTLFNTYFDAHDAPDIGLLHVPGNDGRTRGKSSDNGVGKSLSQSLETSNESADDSEIVTDNVGAEVIVQEGLDKARCNKYSVVTRPNILQLLHMRKEFDDVAHQIYHLMDAELTPSEKLVQIFTFAKDVDSDDIVVTKSNIAGMLISRSDKVAYEFQKLLSCTTAELIDKFEGAPTLSEPEPAMAATPVTEAKVEDDSEAKSRESVESSRNIETRNTSVSDAPTFAAGQSGSAVDKAATQGKEGKQAFVVVSKITIKAILEQRNEEAARAFLEEHK